MVKKHGSRKNPHAQSKAALDLRTLADLRGKFQRQADEEVAATAHLKGSLESPAPGTAGNRWLHAYAGPEDNWGRGKSKGKGDRAREVVYRLSSGLSSDFRENFKLNAVLAGRAISADPEAGLNTWLAACFQYVRQGGREYLRSATPDGGGLILRICQVSANLCTHLLQEGYEALPAGSLIQPLANPIPALPETGREKPRKRKGRGVPQPMPKYQGRLKSAIKEAWYRHGRRADCRTICREVDEQPLAIDESEYPWPAPGGQRGLEARYDGPARHKIAVYVGKIKRDMIAAKQL